MRVFVGLLVLSVTAGCGGGSDATLGETTTIAATPSSTSTPASTGPAVTETPVTEVPTVATEAPSTTAPNPCETSGGLPGEAVELSTLTADLDGDSLPDSLTTYGIPTGDGPMRWRVRLVPAHGPISELELLDASEPTRLLGPVQVDASAITATGQADEVLLSVGTAATGVNLAVLGADDNGCVFEFGDALGSPAVFTIGASVTYAGGLRCEGTGGAQYLVQLTAESTDGMSYTTHDTKLQRVGTNLIPETVLDGTADANGDSLFQYSQVNCSGITLPSLDGGVAGVGG